MLGQDGSSVKASTVFDTGDTAGGTFGYIAAVGVSDGTVAIAYRDNEDGNKGKLLTFDSSGNGVVTETLFADTGIQDPSPATIASTGNLFMAY